jgi:uncharacterized iron-regulated membrane protein
MRKRVWQIHSWLGLICGLFLVLIGLTGSLLVFSHELDALFHPRMVRVEQTGPRLSFDHLLREVNRQLPGYEVVGWPISANPHAADAVRVRQRGHPEWTRAYVNSYTGQVLGHGEWRGTVSDWLLELHYSLFLKTWGTAVCGVVAVGFCILGLTGIWLYWVFWRSFFSLRWGKSVRIFCSDLHKAVGISSVVFNLILGFTGAWWNLPSIPQVWNPPPEIPSPAERLYSVSISISAMMTEAVRQLPGLDLSETNLGFPRGVGQPFIVRGRLASHPFASPFGSSVSFDAQTGAVLEKSDLRQQPLWAQIEDAMGPLHFGTFGGWPVKVLWCVGGLTPGILSLSGFLIWRARRTRSGPTAGR